MNPYLMEELIRQREQGCADLFADAPRRHGSADGAAAVSGAAPDGC